MIISVKVVGAVISTSASSVVFNIGCTCIAMTHVTRLGMYEMIANHLIQSELTQIFIYLLYK